MLDGKQSGNADGNIPVNNGVLNVNLNAEFFDGLRSNVFARLANPVFTGAPQAPTANLGANTAQLATTAFVQQALGTVNLGSRVAKTGDSMTGPLTLNNGQLFLRGLSGNSNSSVVYLNASNNRYLHYDGGNYTMPGANLYVNGGMVWHSGNISPWHPGNIGTPLNHVHGGWWERAETISNCGAYPVKIGWEVVRTGNEVISRKVIQNCKSNNCNCGNQ